MNQQPFKHKSSYSHFLGQQLDGVLVVHQGMSKHPIQGKLIPRMKSNNSFATTQRNTASLPTYRFVSLDANQDSTNLAGTATLPRRVYSNT
jgi:hypothetical protein